MLFKEIIKNKKAKIGFIITLSILCLLIVGGCFATMRIKEITGDSNSVLIRVPNVTEEDFDASFSPVVTTIPSGTIVYSTNKDLLLTNTLTVDSVLTQAKISSTVLNNKYGAGAIVYTSLTPTIASVDSSGNVTRITDGVAKILVNLGKFVKKVLSINVSYTNGSPTTTYAYTSGNLGKNISDGLDNLISNVTSVNVNTYKPIFTTRAADSTNFTSWTAVTIDAGGNNINDVMYGNGVYVAVGDNGMGYYSTDYTSWTAVTLDAGGSSINGITYGAGYFVAVGAGGKAFYSTNGQSWTSLTGTQTGFGTNNIYSVVYGDRRALDTDRFWAVGAGGKGSYFYTPTGTWTSVTMDASARNINKVDFYPINDNFFAVGDGGMGYSAGATANSWSSALIDPTGANLYGVDKGNGKVMAVGAGGRSASQAGGGAYTAVTVDSAGSNIKSVVWGMARMTAVSDSGKIFASGGSGCSSNYISTWGTGVTLGSGTALNSIKTSYEINAFMVVGANGKGFIGPRSIYTRNTNCWANSLDMTFLGVTDDTGECGSAGTMAPNLISPRHVLFANHYTPATGSELEFATNDGTIITARMEKVIGSIGNTDIAIGILDRDMPSSLVPATFLPTNWYSYMPGLANASVPLLCSNRNKAALVYDMSKASSSPSSFGGNQPTVAETHRRVLWEDLAGGDSSNPCIMIINNQPVMVGTWWYKYGGPFHAYYINAMNTAMDSLSSSMGIASRYHMTTIDLSSFPIY